MAKRRAQRVPAKCDPWRRFSAALALKAARDATGRDPELRAEARAWLAGEDGRAMLDSLEIPRSKLAAFLNSLDDDA